MNLENTAQVSYTTDYKDGSSLIMRWSNTGWVEFLNKTGKVYYCQHPRKEIFSFIKRSIFSRINKLLEVGAADLQNLNDIGLTQYLADERLKKSFVLPPMASVENGKLQINTGTTRLTAELLCGTPESDISIILYVPNSETFDFHGSFHSVKDLASTGEFEKELNIDTIDYAININLNPNNPERIIFANSIVRHTIYDFTEGERTNRPTLFFNLGNRLLGMLNRFRTEEGQIAVHINCTEQVSKLISVTSDRYKIDVTIQPDDEWEWSYGKILAEAFETGRNQVPRIHIWLFGIQEPITEDTLNMVIMWINYNFSAFHTRSKKLLTFLPGSIDKLGEVGNFVR